MKKIILAAVMLIAMQPFATAQNVGIGTNIPNASAQLDITATNKGLLIPRMNTAAITAISNPAKGLLVLDTARNQLVFNIGTPGAPNWQTISFNSGWGTTGNAGTNPATNFIGTTDDADVIFKRGNVAAGRINESEGLTALGVGALNSVQLFSFANTAIGSYSLASNSDGQTNTAVGGNSLTSNTSGSQNTAVGGEAMHTNTLGGYSTALGHSALYSNVSGNDNTAVGRDCLYFTTGSANTALGFDAGFRNGAGSGNVFIGYRAGTIDPNLSNRLYIDNTRSGNQSLIYGEFDNRILSVGGRLGIGTITPQNLLHLKDSNTDNNASQLIIEGNSNFGNSTTAAIEFRSNFSSNGSGPSARIKSYYTSNNSTDAKTTFQTIAPGPVFVDAMTLTNGRVGIGTTSPNGDLQLPNTLVNRKLVLYEDANNDNQYNGFGINTSIMRYQVAASTSSHVFYTGSSPSTSNELMRITGNGEVGIGKIPLTSINDSRLQVKQKGNQNGIGVEAENSANHWDFYTSPDVASNFGLLYNGVLKGVFDNATGNYIAVSDRRMKKDITPQVPVLNNVLQLQAYQYHYLDNKTSDRFSNGFMAQDVQKIFPDAVVENEMKDGQKRLGINYQYFTVLAIKGLQEQQKEMEEMKVQMKMMMEEIEKLKKK